MTEITLHNFSPVGKAVLHRAVGLQKNHTIASEPLCCKNCETSEKKQQWSIFPESKQYLAAYNQCIKCPHKKNIIIYEERLKYINEKNMFGYAPRLKKNAILLFLSYHLLGPDANGILRNINVSELANLIGCNEKTIRSNNDLLVKNGYIYQSNSLHSNCINICLCDYKNYFKDAREGGRGFYTISKDLFQNLLKVHSSNLLRIIIKELIELDDPGRQIRNIGDDSKIEKSYHELRRFLPDYCKPGVIRKILEVGSEIFSFIVTSSGVRFILRENFNCKKVKEKLYKVNEKELLEKLQTLEDDSKLAEEQSIPLFHEPFFHNLVTDTYKKISFSQDQIKDMVALSVQYSIPFVMKALSEIYVTYTCVGKRIKNLGGLLRTCIKKYLTPSFRNIPI